MKVPKVKNSVYLLAGDVRHLLTSLLISPARLLQQEQKHFKPRIYVLKESDKLGDAVKLPATNRCSQIRKGYRLPAPATPSLFSLFRKRFTFKCSFTKSIFQESLAQRNGQTVA